MIPLKHSSSHEAVPLSAISFSGASDHSYSIQHCPILALNQTTNTTFWNSTQVTLYMPCILPLEHSSSQQVVLMPAKSSCEPSDPSNSIQHCPSPALSQTATATVWNSAPVTLYKACSLPLEPSSSQEGGLYGCQQIQWSISSQLFYSALPSPALKKTATAADWH